MSVSSLWHYATDPEHGRASYWTLVSYLKHPQREKQIRSLYHRFIFHLYTFNPFYAGYSGSSVDLAVSAEIPVLALCLREVRTGEISILNNAFVCTRIYRCVMEELAAALYARRQRTPSIKKRAAHSHLVEPATHAASTSFSSTKEQSYPLQPSRSLAMPLVASALVDRSPISSGTQHRVNVLFASMRGDGTIPGLSKTDLAITFNTTVEDTLYTVPSLIMEVRGPRESTNADRAWFRQGLAKVVLTALSFHELAGCAESLYVWRDTFSRLLVLPGGQIALEMASSIEAQHVSFESLFGDEQYCLLAWMLERDLRTSDGDWREVCPSLSVFVKTIRRAMDRIGHYRVGEVPDRLRVTDPSGGLADCLVADLCQPSEARSGLKGKADVSSLLKPTNLKKRHMENDLQTVSKRTRTESQKSTRLQAQRKAKAAPSPVDRPQNASKQFALSCYEVDALHNRWTQLQKYCRRTGVEQIEDDASYREVDLDLNLTIRVLKRLGLTGVIVAPSSTIDQILRERQVVVS